MYFSWSKQEGGTVKLEAQVQPAHDPNLSIEWFKNGVQLTTGMSSVNVMIVVPCTYAVLADASATVH